MILDREKIAELVEKKNLIECFSVDCLEGAGYDLRVNRIHRLKSGGFLGAEDRKTPDVEAVDFTRYSLKPGEYVLIETLERVNMPRNLAARVLPRSSLFRCGCALFNALVDPGYQGVLIFGLKNLSDFDFVLERGARVAQIVFEEVAGETRGYDGRYQGGRVV
ncbi:MAG: dCTP deaminase [Candidatus Altiarchaeota archaeon]|nr:dCTP deaminase [Candidatus Altiarchaeota archaeon]